MVLDPLLFMSLPGTCCVFSRVRTGRAVLIKETGCRLRKPVRYTSAQTLESSFIVRHIIAFSTSGISKDDTMMHCAA